MKLIGAGSCLPSKMIRHLLCCLDYSFCETIDSFEATVDFERSLTSKTQRGIDIFTAEVPEMSMPRRDVRYDNIIRTEWKDPSLYCSVQYELR